ncbi:putative eukaryotic porin [Cardiosporidium cionae]|uniref:Eukaryotic porin n=1 Tax=Cardiosporidium cionae TaxID=476202 RepID=A0ABQ7J5J7_9APIC|nr:putative eukaryotic porin [Cardiosporidium cionae]|eukprot:KAF8819281.1 putative eukaryotic porin [Cardiosporidium cionae]
MVFLNSPLRWFSSQSYAAAESGDSSVEGPASPLSNLTGWFQKFIVKPDPSPPVIPKETSLQNKEHPPSASSTTSPSLGNLSTAEPESVRADSSSAAMGGAAPPSFNPSDPLLFENFSREFQNISLQDSFDGFRVEGFKKVNNSLQASHSLILGSQMQKDGSFYQFGPIFSTEDGSLVMMSRASLDGVLNGRIMKQFSHGYDVRLNAISSLQDSNRNLAEFCLNKYGKDWTSSFKYSLQSGMSIFAGSFSQVLHPRFQIGGELMWIPMNGVSVGTIGARYLMGNNTVSGTLTRQPAQSYPSMPANTHLCRLQYVRKITERLSMGSELECSQDFSSSSLKLGWEYLFRHARVQGFVDSSGKISVFSQDSSGLGFSGTADYYNNDFKFGFMLHVVPPPEVGQAPAAPLTL